MKRIRIWIDTSGQNFNFATWGSELLHLLDRIRDKRQRETYINTELHITTFSHLLGGTIVIPMAPHRSTESLVTEIKNTIDVIEGGTNFRMVWHQIKELGVDELTDDYILTDLRWYEFNSESSHQHPENAQYIQYRAQCGVTKEELEKDLNDFVRLAAKAGITPHIVAALSRTRKEESTEVYSSVNRIRIVSPSGSVTEVHEGYEDGIEIVYSKPETDGAPGQLIIRGWKKPSPSLDPEAEPTSR